MKSRPFSERKAIKYYNIAAEKNSVEAFASIGRVLAVQDTLRRAMKDYLIKVIKVNRFKSTQLLLYFVCFLDLIDTLSYINKK